MTRLDRNQRVTTAMWLRTLEALSSLLDEMLAPEKQAARAAHEHVRREFEMRTFNFGTHLSTLIDEDRRRDGFEQMRARQRAAVAQ
jgi:hypothetical protein